MPPTPFHPTHETPFKSSLSSSQQSRRRDEAQTHAISSSSSEGGSAIWPQSFTADRLNPRRWTYLAEGGKNILLRYTGPDEWPFVHPDGRRIALRMTKTTRQSIASTHFDGGAQSPKADEDDDSSVAIDAMEWQRTVLEPDLSGLHSILPPLLRVDEAGDGQISAFLRTIVSTIETLRPMKRRKASGIDAVKTRDLFITEDLSAPVRGKPCLILEVKPKCGFLPNALGESKRGQQKANVSRFRMHAVLKHKEGQRNGAEEAASHMTSAQFAALYDPLDLYSGDDARIRKAGDALYGAWQGASGNNLRIFLDGQKVEPSDATSVAKADALAHACWDGVEASDHQVDVRKAIARILLLPSVQAVLVRLQQLQQRYDSLDVEGVHELCRSELGRGLDRMGNESSISLGEYQDLVARQTHASPTAREAVAGLLLSASYKDCSLFVRTSAPDAQGEEPHVSVHLVDLDPKPTSKLPYFLDIDRQIARTFSQWAQTKDSI